MAKQVIISVIETEATLKRAIKHSSPTVSSRIKMLLYIRSGIHTNTTLANKTGTSVRSIIRWKQSYMCGGFASLVLEIRGGDRKSNIDNATKQKIKAKLSDPKDALTSYKQAQQWISEELNIDKQYHAVYQYLKRNFSTKLKVGMKSHVKKDESAVAVFKKTYPKR
jgi:transposase